MKKFFFSLKNAMTGLRFAFRSERNFRIHCFFAFLAFLVAILLPLTGVELALIFILIFLPLIFEIINTALELLSDAVEPRLKRTVKEIKDLASAAVFLSAFLAVLVGVIIFFSGFVRLLEQV